jgi:cysteine desulfurase
MSTVVSAQFNTQVEPGMLLFQMDLKGVCVSGGSACSSGSLKGSHVLSAIQGDEKLPTLRFSISRNTTSKEIEYAVASLKDILQK